jgi:hypothetical protein
MKQAVPDWKGLVTGCASLLLACQAANGQIFSDNFTRTNDPAPPAPWIVQQGNWLITGGAMNGSAASVNNYGYSYITNTYSDYSVQAQVRFSTNNAWGGGIGGRLDPVTGAHYAAWLYPDISNGGGDALRLVKFSTYSSFGYNGTSFAFMGVANLPSVGTNYHTLLLSMIGSNITASCDGTNVITVTDTDSAAPPYSSGQISLDLYEDNNTYTMFLDNLAVYLLSNAPQANNDSYNATRGVLLTVPAPGVLGNDTGGSGPLHAVLATNATHGTLNLSTNGGFTYISAANFTGTDTWYYAASDGITNSAPAKVTMAVTPPVPPVASNDNYTVTQGLVLNVPAPGVLANDTGGSAPLSALLVTGPTHGILNLNTNGGFVYTPTNNFAGTDTFTYRATDGVTNSSPATVTVTVVPEIPPVANNDTYTLTANSTFSVQAPGVLGNDYQTNGNPLTAVLVSGPTNGTLTLTNNGGFTYIPSGGFSGQDGFVYRATDGVANSSNATVTLSVLPPGTLFFDNFTRATDPGPLTPWVAAVGTDWTVTGGMLVDVGTNQFGTPESGYAFATMPTNSWTNYSVQGTIQFSTTNAFGGGIGACLNPSTGAHYGAWVYPEGSAGGPDILRLVKFSDYSDFGYDGNAVAPIQMTTLPSVGTTQHAVKLAVFQNQIAVFYDGVQVMSVSDQDTAAPPLLGGAISVDRWTPNTGLIYALSADDVIVSTLVVNDSYSMSAIVPLVVGAPGVLGNDTEVFGTNLTAALVSGPANGVLTLNTNGGFTYTANSGFNGIDTFAYEAVDGGNVLGTATVSIVVSGGPGVVFAENFDGVIAPSLPSGWTTDSSVGTNWITQTTNRDTLPNAAFGKDVTNNATSDLVSPPFNLPSGPNQLTFRHQYDLEFGSNTNFDGGVLEIKIGTNAFADILAAGGTFLAGGYNCTIGSDNPLKTRAGWGGNSVNFVTSTVDLPVSAAGQTAQLRWRLGTDSGNGSSVTGWYVDSIIVSNCPASTCWNTPPVLSGLPTQTVNELSLLTVTNKAVDTDVPAQTLAYSLLVKPVGATISTNGIISWTPAEGQGPGTNTFTTRVVDNGSPPLSATNTFTVIVFDVNVPPILPSQTNRTIQGVATLTVANTATDSNIPPAILTYTLLSAPTNATISTNGIIAWTPVIAQVPSTNVFTTVVSNFNSHAITNQHLAATNTFTVVDNTQHNGPSLPGQTNRTIFATTALTVTNTASDTDVPILTLTYQILSPPNGAAINSNGIITWTPDLTQAPSTNVITTVVTDNGTPNLGATNAFTVFVLPPIPIMVSNSAVVTAEGCYPTNNAIDPGETVTLSFGFKNVGATDTANLVVTLLETNGIVAPSGPQTYGVLTAGGAAVSRPFTFIAGGSCGRAITNVFQMQDGASNYGTVSMVFQLGANGPVFAENFDGVTIPVLPAGWSTAITNSSNWVTESSARDTPPNAAFAADVITRGISDLISPAIILPTGSNQLTFRHEYNLEASGPTTYDGGILEIKIGTNAFTDITNGGGVFLSGGYNHVIGSDNPLLGRAAWSGNSGSFVTTSVLLSPAASGQTVQFRWRLGTDTQNGSPVTGWYIDTVSVTGRVCCMRIPPILAAQTNRTIGEFSTLVVTNTATDAQSPPLTLTYALLSPPASAGIDTNGIITWTPAEGQGPSTNAITTVVTDSGSPPYSSTNSFTVVVNDVNVPPTLPAQPNVTIAGITTLVVTNTASDSNIPPAILSYGLLAAPTNAVIDTNGIITWTPVVAQVPSSNTFTTVVTNFNPYAPTNQRLTATNTFIVTVNAIHNGPSLAGQPNRTVNELSLMTVTNTASDTDVPALALSYQLLNPPANASISGNGIITWTPAEGQGPSTNVITTRVVDNGNPPLSATNSFTVVVNDVNVPPVLPTQTNQTIIGLASIVVTNTASDPNIPAATLSYGFLAAPTNAAVDTNGIITWTPVGAQVPSTNVFTTVVTNFNPYALVNQHLTATNSFIVTVAAIHNGPSLPPLTNRTVTALTLLTVTNTAIDSDIPALVLTYELLNPPAGANIDTNGIITWTPAQGQAPGTDTITTIVADSGTPSLSATNSFAVVVNSGTPPSGPSIQSITIDNGIATITWATIPGHTNYVLQYKDDLSITNWNQSGPVTAGGTTGSMTNSIGGAPQRFYRVVAE